MKFEKTQVWGFEHAFRGMRNPKNSWHLSDSHFDDSECHCPERETSCSECEYFDGYGAPCKPLLGNDNTYEFPSKAECARFLSRHYNVDAEKLRWRLKMERSHIFDFDVIYRNAETVHGGSTEQETVHKQVI